MLFSLGIKLSPWRPLPEPTVASLLLVGLLASGSAPLSAQRYGQWSWSAVAGARGTGIDTSVSGNDDSYSEQTLSLAAALNGFILSPALAPFQISLEATNISYDRPALLDNLRLGGSAALQLFPRGASPFQLSYTHREYDYFGEERVPGRLLVGNPDRWTGWEAAGRIRRGPLSGLRYGTRSTRLTFLEEGLRPQESERQYLRWGTSGARIHQSYELKRHARDYGRSDFETEDLNLNTTLDGPLANGWRFNAFGVALRRDLTIRGGDPTRFDSARFRTTFTRSSPTKDILTLAVAAGLSQNARLPSVDEQRFEARYSLRRYDGWQLTPFVAYARQEGNDSSLEAPAIGLSVARFGEAGPVAYSLNASFSALETDQTSRGKSSSSSVEGYSLGGSLSRGVEAGLLVKLEADWAQNQLRRVGETVSDLPDLGAFLETIGTEDRLSGRLTLSRRWRNLHLRAYSDLRQRRGPGDQAQIRADTLTHSLSMQYRNYTANLTSSSTDASNGDLRQSSDYLGGSCHLRLSRMFTLRASYRESERRSFVGDARNDELQAGIDIDYGQLRLRASYFEMNDDLLQGLVRSSRGLRWSISRSHLGWLPIVTTPKRRGVIR